MLIRHAATHQIVDYIIFVIERVSRLDLFVQFLTHVFFENMTVFEGFLTIQTRQPANI